MEMMIYGDSEVNPLRCFLYLFFSVYFNLNLILVVNKPNTTIANSYSFKKPGMANGYALTMNGKFAYLHHVTSLDYSVQVGQQVSL
ncbi:hypothetical protein CEXT_290511 [Caerostris extrusa]|uniref:Uncharacterized protein n=1 Tax=Caerostris extrusa TaxID=172846 RepID=A0AAV4UTT1_CAEEX|nr:hypothetical protein CEXT_290511 [Caerostris extrusa]